MGNVLRALCRWFCKPTDGVSALQDDLQNFENTSQVPKGLNNHVISSKEAQANCYRNLVIAWKKAKPPPKTAEEASFLLIQTLKRDVLADIEGFLEFYGLLHLSAEIPLSLPEGVQFEMLTLPVDAKAVGDGDGMTVYVNTSSPRESKSIPREVVLLAELRSEARAVRDYRCSDALHQNIVDSGYGVLYIQREEILARKYRIRLRGIDAPELGMTYGHKAKDALIKLVQGKCLRVFVYGEDRFGRVVCDAYCNGIFVQEVLLKKGLAWHHKVYDKRVEFANWEKEARGKGVGLWASSNPDKPWEWKRKNKRE